jgi:NTP pyrophosphatase (non-canonical NTP hydrolase)
MLNKLRDEIHANAVAHGWWDEERSFGDIIALCHSELSEALEEYRNGRPLLYFPCNAGGVCCEEAKIANCASKPYNPDDPQAPCSAQSKKPEGIAIELADCIIRILDYCGHAGIDIEEAIRIKHEYNKTRPYRHGGKVI